MAEFYGIAQKYSEFRMHSHSAAVLEWMHREVRQLDRGDQRSLHEAYLGDVLHECMALGDWDRYAYYLKVAEVALEDGLIAPEFYGELLATKLAANGLHAKDRTGELMAVTQERDRYRLELERARVLAIQEKEVDCAPGLDSLT
ncbi:MAG: hypothetical protein HZB91_08440 [Elusimicrobia bacterium]|nr:hypothetical protein [Elusimicrobiota bacterium]